MNVQSNIGHNQGPSLDPIAAVTAEFDGIITEAQNWCDGEPVTDEAGMKAVDAVLKEFKTYKTALNKAGKDRTDPAHKAWKAEVAAVKVYTDDADRIQSALVAVVAPFKKKLADEKAEAERIAWEAANKARREAEKLASNVNAADLVAQRDADAARQTVIDAEKAAQAIGKDTVKGLRKTTHFEVTDYSDLLRWMNKHARAELEVAALEYVRRNHKATAMPGVRTWETKEAF